MAVFVHNSLDKRHIWLDLVFRFPRVIPVVLGMEIARHQTLVPTVVYIVAIVPHTVGMEIKEDMEIVLNIDMWFVQRILPIVTVTVILGIKGDNVMRYYWVKS